MKWCEKIGVGIVLALVAGLLCFNLLFSKERIWTFDGVTHLSNIAQYNVALRDGDFPVRWLDKSANYGMPFGVFSQQTVAYVGALLLFAIPDVLLVAKIIIYVSAFLGSWFLYLFLREYVDWKSALGGAIIYGLNPYRIINIYIRGAYPELVGSILLPVLLLSLKRWIIDKKRSYFLVLVLSVFLLLVTHPISAISYSVLVGIYFVYLIWNRQDKLKIIAMAGLAAGWGVAMAAFYLLPLKAEFKYLYAGLDKTILVNNSSLPWENLIWPERGYFEDRAINQNYYLQIGIVEELLLAGGVIWVGWQLIKKKRIIGLVGVWVSAGLVYLILLSRVGTPVFEKISILGNIQHQWRLLSGMAFVGPIILAMVLGKLKNKYKWIMGLTVILAIIVLRVPKLKGWKYEVNNNQYFASQENLYAQVMNTVWSGRTETYPIKSVKGEIIEGHGEMAERKERNSVRDYVVKSNGPIRMIDNTFYFPGWKVYIDDVLTEIEWQDVNYRGVITYQVPAGQHKIQVIFERTKVRKMADLISLVSMLMWAGTATVMVGVSNQKRS